MIVLEGRSKAVFVFVCTSMYMFIGCVCVNGGGGGGGGLGRENDTVLESAFVIHYDIFEKMLCMVHNAFLKNI